MDTSRDHIEFFGNEEQAKEISKIDGIGDFPVGGKYWLEVEIDDPVMARYLFKWLYAVKETKEPYRLCGCRLNTIWLQRPGDEQIEQIKNIVQEYENKIKNVIL